MPSHIIRVKSKADMQEQIAMHRHNLLAEALLLDVHVNPRTAAGAQKSPTSRALLEATNVGFVDPMEARGPVAGSELAFRLSQAEERLSELDSLIVLSSECGNPGRAEYLAQVREGVTERAQRLRKTLGEIDAGVRPPRGLPHLYLVRVASYGTSGWLESWHASETWVLNTHELGDSTRKKLDKWLRSNPHNSLPHRFVASKGRYQANDKRPATDREVIASLWRHVKPAESLISPSLSQFPLRNAQ